MRERKKGLASGWNRAASMDRTIPINSTHRLAGCKSLEASAVLLAGEGQHAERQLVACGWHDPIALRTACAEHGVTWWSFSDPRSQLIIGYLIMWCADTGRDPEFGVVVKLAELHGCPFRHYPRKHADLFAFIHTATYVGPEEIPVYAAKVARWEHQRERGRELIQQASELLGGDWELLNTARKAPGQLRARIVA